MKLILRFVIRFLSKITMFLRKKPKSTITIPQDIITSILYHLPVKSLCRFRCVSKEWLSLLSEPHFIKTHMKTLNRNHLIFSYNCLYYSVPFSNHEAVSALKKHLPELSRFIFLGSANGLVLASGCDCFVVLNLITTDYVRLPNYLRRQKGHEDTLGFGYDSMTDDYKVVIIFRIKPRSGHKQMSLTYPSNVYVYSLRTCTWRQLSDSPYHSLYGRPEGVFVNGFIHWIAWKAFDHIPVIVAFSLADETFSEVASPNLYNNGHEVSLDTCKLVALGDKLALFNGAIFNGEKGLVWLMNEHGLEKYWTKIVFYGYNKITMINPENLFATDDLTRIYYLEEGSLPKSCDISNINLYRVVSTFVESIVSPKLDRAN